MPESSDHKPSPMPGVSMQWLMDDKISENAGLSLARMTVEPGVVSEAHLHSNCTEAIHVLSGDIEQRVGSEWSRLSNGDTILVPARIAHQTRNIGKKTAVLMIAYSNGSRNYEIEL